jgi:hypothetical protein
MNLLVLIGLPIVILIPICIYALVSEKKDKKIVAPEVPANA